MTYDVSGLDTYQTTHDAGMYIRPDSCQHTDLINK